MNELRHSLQDVALHGDDCFIGDVVSHIRCAGIVQSASSERKQAAELRLQAGDSIGALEFAAFAKQRIEIQAQILVDEGQLRVLGRVCRACEGG